MIRVLVFAPEQALAAWIDEELAEEKMTVQIGRTIAQVVSALVEDPPPRAQILIADFDAVAPGDLFLLQTIRERGWFGLIVALGTVPSSLRTSLAIAHVMPPPHRRHSLRNLVGRTGIGLATTKMPRIDE